MFFGRERRIDGAFPLKEGASYIYFPSDHRDQSLSPVRIFDSGRRFSLYTMDPYFSISNITVTEEAWPLAHLARHWSFPGRGVFDRIL
jgi:hypothetical protein